MIKVVLTGALGRMSGMVAAEIAASDVIEVVGAVDSPDNPGIGTPLGGACKEDTIAVTSSIGDVIEACDLVVDFSSPASSPLFLAACLEAGKGFITGTTSLPEGFLKEAARASEEIPVLVSPNMSAGVNLMFRLAGEVAAALPDFDIEISEIHHNRKKDAPSGTAAKLAERIMEARMNPTHINEDQDPRDLHLVHGREGLVGERGSCEIGMHSLRGGDVTGEHTIVFAGEGERIELVHRAHSRRTFARGAIKTILFMADKGPGMYSMEDVLGL